MQNVGKFLSPNGRQLTYIAGQLAVSGVNIRLHICDLFLPLSVTFHGHIALD